MELTFGKRLREAREQRRLTQEQFAELGGVKRVSQHLYEQDARVPDLNYLRRLKEHGVDAAQLLWGNQTSVRTGTGVSSDLYVDAFRIVDRLARTEAGDPLPYPERERFFKFLCQILEQDQKPESGADLQDRLIRFMGS